MPNRPKYRWFQFSLRAVLVFTAMIGCFLAGWKARDIAAYVPRNPIKIDGIILSINENVYELSVGSDDAVTIGTVFTVSRAGTKLGDIVVLDASPDRCLGMVKQSNSTLVERFLGKSSSPVIQVGDSVVAIISQEQLDEIWRQNGVMKANTRLMRAH